MKITRQRLKDIIMEEIALQEATDTLNVINTGNEKTSNIADMADISESELEEGVEMVTLDNIKLVADVVAQMGANFTPAIALAIAGMSFKDAIKYLLDKKKDADKETETALEEAEEGTLEELITQAIQEELAQLASKNVK